mgnify:CR=1 FL=1
MMNRKSILPTALVLLLLALTASCRESLEKRGAREAAEYTRKHCPTPVEPRIMMDSMTFDRVHHTFSYCYTLSGELDDSALIANGNAKELLLQQLRNSTHLKLYKEAGYNFRYVYHSSKKHGTTLFETTFRPEDYQ